LADLDPTQAYIVLPVAHFLQRLTPDAPLTDHLAGNHVKDGLIVVHRTLPKIVSNLNAAVPTGGTAFLSALVGEEIYHEATGETGLDVEARLAAHAAERLMELMDGGVETLVEQILQGGLVDPAFAEKITNRKLKPEQPRAIKRSSTGRSGPSPVVITVEPPNRMEITAPVQRPSTVAAMREAWAVGMQRKPQLAPEWKPTAGQRLSLLSVGTATDSQDKIRGLRPQFISVAAGGGIEAIFQNTMGIVRAYRKDGGYADYAPESIGDTYWYVFLPGDTADIDIYFFNAQEGTFEKQGGGRIPVEQVARTDDMATGAAWSNWITGNLEKPQASESGLPDREVLLGFLSSLFAPYSQRWYATHDLVRGLPHIPPDPVVRVALLRQFIAAYNARNGGAAHGPVETLLAQAAVGLVLPGSELLQNLNDLLEAAPGAAPVAAVKIIGHIHKYLSGGHPLEVMPDGTMGFIDIEMLIQCVPYLVRQIKAIDNQTTHNMPRPIALWILAAALDPHNYWERSELIPAETTWSASMSRPESVSSSTASFGCSTASWRISRRFFSPPEKPSLT